MPQTPEHDLIVSGVLKKGGLQLEALGSLSGASGSGARCGRITATTATPGTTSPMIRPGPARIAGARMDWPESATTTRCCALRWRSGTAGSDPQGAAVRPDQQRGQSRRGRQGVLLLPRQHADSLLHEVPVQVPRRRLIPTADLVDDQSPALARSELEYELLDTGVFNDDRYFDVVVEYAKAAPEDMLIQHQRPQSRA